MALTAPYPKVQGSRFLLGPELQAVTVLIIPGTSDYTTNGYVITAINAGFKAIQQAIITGGNATAYPAAAARWAVPVFPETQMGAASTGDGFTGYSQFLLKVIVSSTGAESGNGDNLTGYIWQVMIIGY
jgi:hypothetical protein